MKKIFIYLTLFVSVFLSTEAVKIDLSKGLNAFDGTGVTVEPHQGALLRYENNGIQVTVNRSDAWQGSRFYIDTTSMGNFSAFIFKAKGSADVPFTFYIGGKAVGSINAGNFDVNYRVQDISGNIQVAAFQEKLGIRGQITFTDLSFEGENLLIGEKNFLSDKSMLLEPHQGVGLESLDGKLIVTINKTATWQGPKWNFDNGSFQGNKKFFLNVKGSSDFNDVLFYIIYQTPNGQKLVQYSQKVVNGAFDFKHVFHLDNLTLGQKITLFVHQGHHDRLGKITFDELKGGIYDGDIVPPAPAVVPPVVDQVMPTQPLAGALEGELRRREDVAAAVEAERVRFAREEQERQDRALAQRLHNEELERVRLEQEQRDREAAERVRLEQEQRDREAAERARLEQEQRDREAAERARLEQEQRDREAAERVRLEQEQRDREAAERARLETERLAREEAERQRLIVEARREAERLEAERVRLAAEKEASFVRSFASVRDTKALREGKVVSKNGIHYRALTLKSFEGVGDGFVLYYFNPQSETTLAWQAEYGIRRNNQDLGKIAILEKIDESMVNALNGQWVDFSGDDLNTLVTTGTLTKDTWQYRVKDKAVLEEAYGGLTAGTIRGSIPLHSRELKVYSADENKAQYRLYQPFAYKEGFYEIERTKRPLPAPAPTPAPVATPVPAPVLIAPAAQVPAPSILSAVPLPSDSAQERRADQAAVMKKRPHIQRRREGDFLPIINHDYVVDLFDKTRVLIGGHNYRLAQSYETSKAYVQSHKTSSQEFELRYTGKDEQGNGLYTLYHGNDVIEANLRITRGVKAESVVAGDDDGVQVVAPPPPSTPVAGGGKKVWATVDAPSHASTTPQKPVPSVIQEQVARDASDNVLTAAQLAHLSAATQGKGDAVGEEKQQDMTNSIVFQPVDVGKTTIQINFGEHHEKTVGVDATIHLPKIKIKDEVNKEGKKGGWKRINGKDVKVEDIPAKHTPAQYIEAQDYVLQGGYVMLKGERKNIVVGDVKGEQKGYVEYTDNSGNLHKALANRNPMKFMFDRYGSPSDLKHPRPKIEGFGVVINGEIFLLDDLHHYGAYQNEDKNNPEPYIDFAKTKKKKENREEAERNIAAAKAAQAAAEGSSSRSSSGTNIWDSVSARISSDSESITAATDANPSNDDEWD